MIYRSILFIFFLFIYSSSFGQDCIGGAITSNENYLYGRFEVRMQSAPGNGVVSSFFMYNVELNCNWPAENNEIDVEMTGNTEDLFFTTHYPGPWYYGDVHDVSFNPHEEMHDYAFEWEPGIVRWFIDGQLVNVQNQSFVSDLIYPMRIMMNLWAAEAVDWVGVWDPSVMPVESHYDWVKYYEYTPGAGNYGTNNQFTFGWEENFNALDSEKWTVTEEGGFNGNYCTFRSSSVEFDNGIMTLQLEEPAPLETIPVTFRVNTANYDLTNNDVINLNGSFNNWCGSCLPMIQNGDIWTRTILVPVGNHEFIFTKNFWVDSAGPTIGSSCDFNPCDEFTNYGLVVPAGSDPITIDTYCWGECSDCIPGGLSLDLKVVLEGPYDSLTNLMADGLRTSQNIPLEEPYVNFGYTHAGDGGMETTNNGILSNSGSDAIVDWVIVEIRSALDPTLVVQTKSALVQRDGDVVEANGTSPIYFENIDAPGCYVAIRHRNHFGVRNLTPFANAGIFSFDFTDPLLPTYGTTPLKLVDGINVLVAADANGDGQINSIDKNSFWRLENGSSYNYSINKADFNMDGAINSADKNLLWRENNSKVEELD